MRIAIATWFPRDPDRPLGGVEAVSVNLVRSLAQQAGVDLHVITLDSHVRTTEVSSLSFSPACAPALPFSDGRSVSLRPPGFRAGPPPEAGTATVHRLAAGHGRLLLRAIGRGRSRLNAYLRQLRPDVVHAHDTYGIFVHGWNGPRVLTIHGFIHEDTCYGQGRLRGLRSTLWRWFECRAWADHPHIISISPFVRARLRGLATGIIHDIENPVSPEFFEISPRPVPGAIFSAGSVWPLKNTLGLVRAFERISRNLPHARLQIAGSLSDPMYADAIRTFIDRSGISQRVTLLGPASPARIRQELARASLFALTSFQENAPMAIAEASAAALPVVASNRCGMPYMVRDGQSGYLVDPHNPQDIADRLRDLLADADRTRKMGEFGRRFAHRHFHPDVVAKKTLQVYTLAQASPSATRQQSIASA